MENNIEVYWKALERIKNGCPNIVPVGAKVTNDLISLEAGRKKGSIKKSRQQFSDLIEAIDKHALSQSQTQIKNKNSLQSVKDETKALRLQLDAALGREMSLLFELLEVKLKLQAITDEKIIPLRSVNNQSPINQA